MSCTQNPLDPIVVDLAWDLHCDCSCEEDTIAVRRRILRALHRIEAQILGQIQCGRWAEQSLVMARAELEALLCEADELLAAIAEEGVY